MIDFAVKYGYYQFTRITYSHPKIQESPDFTLEDSGTMSRDSVKFSLSRWSCAFSNSLWLATVDVNFKLLIEDVQLKAFIRLFTAHLIELTTLQLFAQPSIYHYLSKKAKLAGPRMMEVVELSFDALDRMSVGVAETIGLLDSMAFNTQDPQGINGVVLPTVPKLLNEMVVQANGSYDNLLNNLNYQHLANAIEMGTSLELQPLVKKMRRVSKGATADLSGQDRRITWMQSADPSQHNDRRTINTFRSIHTYTPFPESFKVVPPPSGTDPNQRRVTQIATRYGMETVPSSHFLNHSFLSDQIDFCQETDPNFQDRDGFPISMFNSVHAKHLAAWAAKGKLSSLKKYTYYYDCPRTRGPRDVRSVGDYFDLVIPGYKGIYLSTVSKQITNYLQAGTMNFNMLPPKDQYVYLQNFLETLLSSCTSNKERD